MLRQKFSNKFRHLNQILQTGKGVEIDEYPNIEVSKNSVNLNDILNNQKEFNKTKTCESNNRITSQSSKNKKNNQIDIEVEDEKLPIIIHDSEKQKKNNLLSLDYENKKYLNSRALYSDENFKSTNSKLSFKCLKRFSENNLINMVDSSRQIRSKENSVPKNTTIAKSNIFFTPKILGKNLTQNMNLLSGKNTSIVKVNNNFKSQKFLHYKPSDPLFKGQKGLNILTSAFINNKKIPYCNLGLKKLTNKTGINKKEISITINKDNYIQNLLKNHIYQFEETDNDIICNIAYSFEQHFYNLENPLKIEFNDYLLENNLEYKDLFSNRLDAFSCNDECIVDDSEEETIDEYEFEDYFKKINLHEILNEKGEEQDKESIITYQKNKLEKLSSFHSSQSGSKISLNQSQILIDNDKLNKNFEKNVVNNKKKECSSQKIAEVMFYNEKTNNIIDFYGDLKMKKKKIEENNFKNYGMKEETPHNKNHNFNSCNNNYENFDKQKEKSKNTFDSKEFNKTKNVKFVDDSKEEINLIKTNRNKIKKLNIEVEEVNETPFNNAGNIKNSKRKKIIKTEYIKEEKIYEITKNRNCNKANDIDNTTDKENIGRNASYKVETGHRKGNDIEFMNSNVRLKNNLYNKNCKNTFSSIENINSSFSKQNREQSLFLNPTSIENTINIQNDNELKILNSIKKKSFDINKFNDYECNNKNEIRTVDSFKGSGAMNSHETHHHDGHKKPTLEESLMENLTQKVVILILLLLIVLPILGGDYVKTFLFNTDDTEIRSYCMEVIPYLFDTAMKDPSKISNLQRHVDKCERISIDMAELSDFESNDPYFLYLNFSDYIPYYDLLQKYNNTNLSNFIPNIEYDNLTKRENSQFLREGYDFYTDSYFDSTHSDEEDSKIIYIYNNRIFLIIDNLTGILKSIFVGVVLVWGAFVVSNDVTKILIVPLERVKAKMNYLLRHSDEIYMKEEKLKEQSNNVVNEIVKDENIDKTIEKKLLKEDWEFRVLHSSVVSLINLVSMSLGQNSKNSINVASFLNFFFINICEI